MAGYTPLPAYRIDNAMINFQPMSEGIDAVVKGERQGYERTNAMAFGQAMADGDQKAAMIAGAKIDPKVAMEAGLYADKQKQAQNDAKLSTAKLLGGQMQTFVDMKDPAEQRAAIEKWMTSHESDPSFAQDLKKLGVADWRADPLQAVKVIHSTAIGPQDAESQAKTKAQTEQALANAAENRAQATISYPAKANSDNATARLHNAQADNLGSEGAGYKDLHTRVTTERELRAEFEKHQTVKDYSVVRDNYGKVQGAAIDKSPAGDISMIFAYMKMLDPGSVVREGEFATAQNATGVPDRVTNLYNQVLAGNRLNNEQRKDFENQASRLYQVHERQYGAVRGQYEAIAKNARLDPRFVTTDLGKVNQGEVPAYGSGPARPGQAPGTVPNGKQNTGRLPDGVSATEAISQARAAIAAGKDPALVIKRLQQLGVPTDGL